MKSLRMILKEAKMKSLRMILKEAEMKISYKILISSKRFYNKFQKMNVGIVS